VPELLLSLNVNVCVLEVEGLSTYHNPIRSRPVSLIVLAKVQMFPIESVGGVETLVALPFSTWQAAMKFAPVVLIALVVTGSVPDPVL